MTPAPAAPCDGFNRLEVDLGAIAGNVREIRRAIGTKPRMFAVVKGNAYGLGAVQVATTALANGADALALVHTGDAVALREAGVDAPILLYGGTLGDRRQVQVAEQRDLTATVVDFESASFHSRFAESCVRVFVEVDAGLERLGIPAEEAAHTIARILALPRLRVDGIYTHLRVEGVYGDRYHPSTARFVSWQYDRFSRVLEQLDRSGIAIPITMAASSPLVRLSSSMNLNAVDTGRLIYGIVPEVPAGVALRLRPAFRSLKSRLIQIKDIHRTEFVEEAGFSVRDVRKIGVIPMGLADGLADTTCGEVLVRGTRHAIVGTFLEHARIDLTGAGGARVGDEVVIVGEGGGQCITTEEVFAHQGVRMPAGLGVLVRGSVKRVYV